MQAVGFAVDYSAHIAWGFATASAGADDGGGRSSKNVRAAKALEELGVPVFQGGFGEPPSGAGIHAPHCVLIFLSDSLQKVCRGA